MAVDGAVNIPAANLADIYSAASGVLFALIGCGIRACSPKAAPWNSVGLIVGDLLKGGSFFPFVLLSLSIAYPAMLTLLLTGNRVVLSLSGVIAALYVVGEFVRTAQGKTHGG